MTDTEKRLLFDAWKHTVDVQMHFNDLELRIRNFAFVLTGAFLALGGYALRDGSIIEFWGLEFATATLIVFVAIIPVCAFRMMDLKWYHPLLIGSVREGEKLEAILRENGVDISLGREISRASSLPSYFAGEVWDFSIEDIDNGKVPNGAAVKSRNGKRVATKWKIPVRRFRSEDKMKRFYLILIAALAIVGIALSIPVWASVENDAVSNDSKIEIRIN